MSKPAFDIAIERLWKNEGGYVDDPHDPGGETNWGISKRAYPDLDIKALTQDEARSIYLKDYWMLGRIDKLPPAIAYQVFDAAVNHGLLAAHRMLQRAAGVEDDGILGPASIEAVLSADPAKIVIAFIGERLDYWTRCGAWGTAGKGWTRRAAQNLRYAAQDI